MARPRTFELEDALDQAQAVFWKQGYAATTTAELAQAMGIQKGSLFNAFGDKRSLYIQTLTRYLDKGYDKLISALSESVDPLGALQQWVEDVAAYCTSEEGKNGCFGVNSSVGLSARDNELSELVTNHWNRVREAFSKALSNAQQIGQVNPNADPHTLANVVMVHLVGMNVIARQGQAKGGFKRSTTALFDGFRSC